MKTIALGAIFFLFLLSIAAPVITSASGGPSVSGTYRFILDDELTKSVEFSAQTDERGTTTGQLTFSDEARISDVDPEDFEGHDEPSPVSLTAKLDGLTIDRNRAVLSGVVTDSNHPSYIGKWIQLVVEDNGSEGDQVNWRVCPVMPEGWVPADAEDPRDEGAYWHWWATDAELRDDVGIPSASVMPGQPHGCQLVSLPAFTFTEIRGEGQITVQQ